MAWLCILLFDSFQNFCEEVAGDMSAFLLLLAEAMVGIGHQVPFALLVEVVETLAVGVRHHSVGIAVENALRTLIILCRLVDRQADGSADIVATEAFAAPHLYLGRRILGVVHLAEGVASQSVIS